MDSHLSTESVDCWIDCLPPLYKPAGGIFPIVLAGENTNVLQGLESQLPSTAVIWEGAEGEGSFRWSGITETFVIPIKSKADVSPARLPAPISKVESHEWIQTETKPLLNKLHTILG